ncbi:MAG: hypothetical protein H6707_03165 [Deltaproteobacteria bacterium]|nr:hypothetical protein [Deltaproteobacteria bacterium]MCB9555078.1 hypothetical protein [Deltaproteobacteria bacterium]
MSEQEDPDASGLRRARDAPRVDAVAEERYALQEPLFARRQKPHQRSRKK